MAGGVEERRKVWKGGYTIHSHLPIFPIPVISTTLIFTIKWSDRENSEVPGRCKCIIVRVYKINEKAEEERNCIWEYILHKKYRTVKYFISNCQKISS